MALTRSMPPMPKRLTCLKHRRASSTKLSTSALSVRSRSGGAAWLTWACTPTRYIRVSNTYGRISVPRDQFDRFFFLIRIVFDKPAHQYSASCGENAAACTIRARHGGARSTRRARARVNSPVGCGVSYQSISGSRIPPRSLPVATMTLGLRNVSKSVWSSWSTTVISVCRLENRELGRSARGN